MTRLPYLAKRGALGVLGAFLGVVAAATATTAATVQTEALIVTVRDGLDPATLEVAPGTVVVWKNDDSERHRLRARDAPTPFDSGNVEPGETFSFAFAVEGTYPYSDERDEDDPRYQGRIVVRARAEADDPSEESPSPRPSTGPPGDEQSSAAPTAVSILDRSFSPASVSIVAGGTVAWTNSSDREHTVTFSEALPSSEVLAPGGSFTQTFDSPGTFGYLCAIHPEMTGTVTVTGSPAADGVAPTTEQGLTVGSPVGLDLGHREGSDGNGLISGSIRSVPSWLLLPGITGGAAGALLAMAAGFRRIRTRHSETS